MAREEDWEDIDLDYLQYFWDLSSEEMVHIIEQAINRNRPKFYIKLLNDMLQKKREAEKKEND